MKQVFLSGQGRIEVNEAPVPGKLYKGVLVQNAFSLISAGTEGSAVTKNSGLRGLYEKAMNSKDKFGQIWDMAKSQGFRNTAEALQSKLSDMTALGYTSAGIVLEIEENVKDCKVGQRVACMGVGYASHAEFVVVPEQLTVNLPDTVSFESAAFGAIACIAMQGIRRLELSPGERVGIIGLGLIGQLALRLAQAMGYEAYGFDISGEKVEHARRYCQSSGVVNSAQTDPGMQVNTWTEGESLDGIVICASSDSDALINSAFSLCRRRGRVSVVGDVGLGLERARMYAKELELRLSCSYGPGRYDSNYELRGIDYPIEFARWTEKRNLEYFISLLHSGRLNVDDLITEKFPVVRATEAYSRIKSDPLRTFGVLLDYALPSPQNCGLPKDAFKIIANPQPQIRTGSVHVGLIGVGGYAKNVHVPNLGKIKAATVSAVASRSGASAAVVAKKIGAAYATSDTNQILSDDDVHAVVISTRHESHAELVLRALASGKHVFVEKPMATTILDCLKILREVQKGESILRVGYNRRFSPQLKVMKSNLGNGPRVLNVRVNVGAMGNHWSNTAEEGGRLMGEGVHFFDFATWMLDSKPLSVQASFVGEASVTNPDASISIAYENGSVANINYVTIGSTKRGKEYFEAFGNGRCVVVDDYKGVEIYGQSKKVVRDGMNDKGQLAAMTEFINAILGQESGGGADAVAGLYATAIAEAAVLSGREKAVIKLDEYIKEKASALSS
ncbi:bi-domain-containing oxidoreductase [Pigmentiphaga sp. YJ18]|uniref:bi-domain-containing oxidoreductase n=1 Tax=Pigmentiphaga sp. YJ18 TaxID=3134907 RepID=UPI003118204D